MTSEGRDVTATEVTPTPFADLPAAERARIIDELLGPPAVARYTSEEMARLGPEVYDRVVRPHLTTEDDGKFVILDPDSGDYAMDQDSWAAQRRFSTLRPGVVGWCVRVGYVAVFRHGGRPGGWKRV